MAHSQGRWWEASVPLTRTAPQSYSGVLTIWQPAFPKVSHERQRQGSCSAFDDLVSEILHNCFHPVLFLRRESLVWPAHKCWRMRFLFWEGSVKTFSDIFQPTTLCDRPAHTWWLKTTTFTHSVIWAGLSCTVLLLVSCGVPRAAVIT